MGVVPGGTVGDAVAFAGGVLVGVPGVIVETGASPHRCFFPLCCPELSFTVLILCIAIKGPSSRRASFTAPLEAFPREYPAGTIGSLTGGFTSSAGPTTF